MALFTGLSDRGHGVEQSHQRLDPLRTTLAEHFRGAGYATAGFFSGPLLDGKYGFDRGFDEYAFAGMSPEEASEAAAREFDLGDGAAGAAGEPDPDVLLKMRKALLRWDVSSPRVNESAFAFLDRHAGRQPFFLFLHYFDVHHDYVPERADPELARTFDPAYRGTMSGRNWLQSPEVRKTVRGRTVRRIGERDLAHVRALYDAEIHWVDRHIGAVLGKLEESGVAGRTIVAVVSDHGEEFFEHDGIAHATSLFTELVRIPFILRAPGALPGGRRVREVVRIYDVAPTLVDYAGLEPLPKTEGRSLRPLLEGDGRSAAAPSGALSRLTLYRTGGASNLRDAWRNDRFTVIRGFLPAAIGEDGVLEARIAVQPGTGQRAVLVYDRRTDPHERQPLSPTDPRYAEALRAFEEDFRAAEQFAGALRRSDPAERRAPAVAEQEREFLAELGYAAPSGEEGAEPPEVGPFPTPLDEG